jgi:protocatechuate 4,5-dioxygenase alpha chain
MPKKKMRKVAGTTHFDGPMATRGYPLNRMCFSFNSAEGRRAFEDDEEGCMERYRLTDAQKDAVRSRDVLAMIREGGSIYYLAKFGQILGLNMQDFGGLQSGRTTEEFQAYLDSQGVGKKHG